MNNFDALRNGDKFDFMYEDNPKCPHCGHVCSVSENEWWYIYEEGEHQVECSACDAEFEVSTTVTHSFSTDYQPDEIDCDSGSGAEREDSRSEAEAVGTQSGPNADSGIAQPHPKDSQ